MDLNHRTAHALRGMGWGLLLGAAIGAAGCCGVCGLPTKRRMRRRLLSATDAMNDALESFLR